MTDNLVNAKKSRTVIRSSFTKCGNELEKLLLDPEKPDNEPIQVAWELLKSKYDDLKVLDGTIYELLLEKATEDELEAEIESCDAYVKRFTILRIKYDKLFGDAATVASVRSCSGASTPNVASIAGSTGTQGSSVAENQGMRKFKLPRIEFKQYDGSIKNWLAFWAQFKKVHEDSSIDMNDKIEYLIQATVPGSRARQLVESYPAMGENYEKIVEGMQSRFGREDLQIEVYVRELLKLILTNTSSRQKLDIGNLYDRIETQLRSLETLGITSDKCSAMLYPLIESGLPHELLRAWQRSSTYNNSSDDTSACSLEIRLKNLMLFIKQEVENEQRITLATEGFGLHDNLPSVKTVDTQKRQSRNKFSNDNSGCSTAAGLMNTEVASCIFCAGSHDSEACFKAQKMTCSQKKSLLSKKRACFRCLRIGHQSPRCRGRLRCILCSRSHVTLMCPELPSNKEVSKSHDSNSKSNDSNSKSHDSSSTVASDPPRDQALANQTSSHVFLQTLRLTLKGVSGSKVVRALIDTGSQRSYILKATAIQLGYEIKRSEKVAHCLFGGTVASSFHDCFDITICNGNYSYTFEALDQVVICGDVAPVFYGSWTEEMRVLNVDITDQQTGPIELLLGADVAGSLYTGGRRHLPCGLVAWETRFGWTIMGKVPTKGVRSDVVMTTLNLFVRDASISDLWELDVLGIKEPSDMQNKEEMAMAAKELFLQTVRVDQDKRYEVRLPWLQDHPPLPTNFKLAQKRLGSAIRKLRNENLFDTYQQIFCEWESEGIIEQVGTIDCVDVNKGHYLPHRPVIKENSATTRVRPVYGASAHEKDSPSLNDCLEKGPNLIELIPSMLLKFRYNKMGVVSDIRKAFLQISVNEKDRDFLRFLWVNPEGQQVIVRHKRVVFGVSSSPFLLGATLEYHLSQCLENCGSDAVYSRETVERLSRSFYVDNCITSLPYEESLKRFISEATKILAEGQFELRGWEYTRSLETDAVCDPCPVLGLKWCPQRDILSISQEFLKDDLNTESMVVSKRLILSIAQRVFDPIGYTCPAVLVPKLMLQKLWKENLKWDQPVDDVTAQTFKNWVRDLTYLSRIEIPRWTLTGDSGSQELSIHTFCDASANAYACVVFLRVVLNGKVSVILLAAKARVAPLAKSNSKMTIPRLELLAATIGARLYAHVIKNLKDKVDCFFWSDSSTVISWIQRKEEWGIFVWNRVAEIRRLTKPEKWSHLPGMHNPADLPSRGCSPKQLLELRWWEGPKWLYGDPDTWPSNNTTYNEQEINSERKKVLVTALLDIGNSCEWHLDYFSKYRKTLGMIAWIFRFIHNCRCPDQKKKGAVAAAEYNDAERWILKLIQRESFSGETDKRISGLNPFYDEDGLIRLKSHVSNREDTEYYRFPVVLPSKHPLVNSLIMDLHAHSCHVGTQGLLSLLREKFWILGGRRTVRAVLSKCVICKRYTAKPWIVAPPSLPLDRVRDAVVFEVTGVDFAGPLYLKNGDKAWICIFTCAVFRAVHLESTTSLSTSSFLQALRRFVSRRGRPKTIYSDNGTNFVGAENAFALLDWDSLTRETAVQRICWRFNPPTAAWWGGFWERLIGVLKRLLRKVLGRASLNYEELLTLVCDCEAVVNARPLTYLSEDHKDLVAITPRCFCVTRWSGVCLIAMLLIINPYVEKCVRYRHCGKILEKGSVVSTSAS